MVLEVGKLLKSILRSFFMFCINTGQQEEMLFITLCMVDT